jgi:DNA repair exonuclease SbcCD ATPase subunit
MKIKRLEIYNYGPFKGENVIEFPDNDFSIYFIQGTYDGDPAKSNRAGKSSFVECIRYLLFGDVRAKKEINLIHTGQDKMYIKGIVNLKGIDVTITRGRTSENKPIFDIEGTKEILKSAKEKELQDLLGYTCEDFVATNCIKQGDISGFMLLGPAERKKVILGWFNLEKWKTYEEKAKARYNSLGKEIETLNTSRSTLEVQLHQISIADLSLLKGAIESTQKSLDEVNNQIADKKAELKNYSNLEDTKQKLQGLQSQFNFTEVQLQTTYGKVSLLTSDIKTAQNNINTSNDLEKTLGDSNEISKKLEELQGIKQPLQSEVAVVDSQIGDKQRLHKTLCSFSGVCPIDSKTCDKGKRIPDYATQIENEIKALQAQKIENTEKLVRLNNVHGQFQQLLNNIALDKNRIAQLRRVDPTLLEDSMASAKELLDNLLKTKEDITKQIEELSGKVKEDQYGVIRSQLSALENERNIRLHKYNESVSALARAEQDITNSDALKAQIIQKQTKLIELQEEYYRMMYVCSLLNKDGIPSLLIENSISEVEDFANVILDSISPGFKLEFTTFKELTSKETHCTVCGNPFGSEAICQKCRYGRRSNKIKEEIDLKVMTSSLQELEFELDSGGGQVLISLALRLALSKLLSKNFNSNGILILDEVFGSLDEPNRNLVSRLLFNRMKDIMNVSQVFVITHCSLNESSYNRIMIKRFDGFSKIHLEK